MGSWEVGKLVVPITSHEPRTTDHGCKADGRRRQKRAPPPSFRRACDCLAESDGVRVAVLRVRGRGAAHDATQFASELPAAARPEHLAQREDVAPLRGHAVYQLLGRGEARRADADGLPVDDGKRAARWTRGVAYALHESEVDQRGLAVAAAEDVRRLEVAVDEPGGVEVGDRGRKRCHERNYLAFGKRQHERLEVLHHVVWHSAAGPGPEEARQRADGERADDFHFQLEALAESVGRVREKLERRLPSEAHVDDPVDFGGPARAHERRDAPYADRLAGRKPAGRGRLRRTRLEEPFYRQSAHLIGLRPGAVPRPRRGPRPACGWR